MPRVFQVASNMQLFAFCVVAPYTERSSTKHACQCLQKNPPVTEDKRHVPTLVLLLQVSQLKNTNKYCTICTAAIRQNCPTTGGYKEMSYIFADQ
jgi:hypothetical protein